MSRQRRNFSAKFKSDLVIELLKGEKDLNTLAVENNIQPNLLRNWKKEFLDNASAVFDDKREDNLKEKLAEEGLLYYKNLDFNNAKRCFLNHAG
jgi:transposase-like protein